MSRKAIKHSNETDVTRASSVPFTRYADFKRAAQNWYEPPYAYGAFGLDTVQNFQNDMAALSGAKYVIAFPSGMAAIAATSMALGEKDKRFIMQDDTYAVGKMFADNILNRYGVEIDYASIDEIEDLLHRPYFDKRVAGIYIESPSYKTYESGDIKMMAENARGHGVPLIVDNSLMSSYFQKPLEMGADVVIESASKHIIGTGGGLLGVVMTNDEALYRKIRDVQILMGMNPAPEDCALASEGLKSLPQRLNKHCRTTKALLNVLKNHDTVKTIHASGYRAAHRKAYKDDPGTPRLPLISVTLKGKFNEAALEDMIDAFDHIRIGYGWGTDYSLILPEISDQGEIRFRLAVGSESAKNLEKDLANGLQALINHSVSLSFDESKGIEPNGTELKIV